MGTSPLRIKAGVVIDAGSRLGTTTTTAHPPRAMRGFAVLKAQGRTSEISASARQGGRTAQARAADPANPRRAHRFTSDEARAAGRKGYESRQRARHQPHDTAA